MEVRTEETEASISNLAMINAPNPSPTTVTVRRKAAKRTERWYNNLASPLPPPVLRIPARRSRARSIGHTRQHLLYHFASLPLQDEDEDMQATKKPRLDTLTATARAEAATKTASPDFALAIPTASVDDDCATNAPSNNTDTVTNAPNNLASPATKKPHLWTPEEDAKLASSVLNIPSGRSVGTLIENVQLPLETPIATTVAGLPDVAMALPPEDTDDDANDDSVTNAPSKNLASPATKKSHPWTPEEDAKLTSAIANTCKKKHGKALRTDWDTIVVLLPGRTKDSANRDCKIPGLA
jgi:hypothetical protein